MKFKADFKGTGTFVGFVSELNKLFGALNNIKVIMPSGYAGKEPTFTFQEKEGAGTNFVADFGQAHVFSVTNISWDVGTTGGATVTEAHVTNGRLYIYVRVHV